MSQYTFRGLRLRDRRRSETYAPLPHKLIMYGMVAFSVMYQVECLVLGVADAGSQNQDVTTCCYPRGNPTI